MANLLLLVEKSHPILRQIIPEIEDFNDLLLYKIIDCMCYSISPSQLIKANSSHETAAGMAANQWGINKRIFIFTPDGSEENKRLEIILNPSYIPYLLPNEIKPKLVAAYEGCFSVPLTAAIINRYEKIVATYYDINGNKFECIMEGWEARVFQHETDHLNGKLIDGTLDNYPGPECLKRIFFKDAAEMKQFWINKVIPNRNIKNNELE